MRRDFGKWRCFQMEGQWHMTLPDEAPIHEVAAYVLCALNAYEAAGLSRESLGQLAAKQRRPKPKAKP